MSKEQGTKSGIVKLYEENPSDRRYEYDPGDFINDDEGQQFNEQSLQEVALLMRIIT